MPEHAVTLRTLPNDIILLGIMRIYDSQADLIERVHSKGASSSTTRRPAPPSAVPHPVPTTANSTTSPARRTKAPPPPLR